MIVAVNGGDLHLLQVVHVIIIVYVKQFVVVIIIVLHFLVVLVKVMQHVRVKVAIVYVIIAIVLVTL